jgi:hypothetical protein
MIERIRWRAIHADLRDIIVMLNVEHETGSPAGVQPAGRGALKM